MAIRLTQHIDLLPLHFCPTALKPKLFQPGKRWQVCEEHDFAEVRRVTFASGDARQVSVIVEKPSPKRPEPQTPFGNSNAGTADSRIASHFDSRPESAARTQKTKAPQTLSSHGTPLSNNPPPKTAHNHSTFCSALGQRPVVIRFVTQSHSSRRKSRSHRVAFVPIVSTSPPHLEPPDYFLPWCSVPVMHLGGKFFRV